MNGIRKTAQRQLILNAIKELNNHPTAEGVFDHIARQYPSVGKATVYRNLRRMAESGEIVNVGSFSGSTHYDHNCREHCHFACDVCGRIFDVEGGFSDIFGRIGDTDGFDITSCHIFFGGLCWNCKAKHGS